MVGIHCGGLVSVFRHVILSSQSSLQSLGLQMEDLCWKWRSGETRPSKRCESRDGQLWGEVHPSHEIRQNCLFQVQLTIILHRYFNIEKYKSHFHSYYLRGRHPTLRRADRSWLSLPQDSIWDPSPICMKRQNEQNITTCSPKRLKRLFLMLKVSFGWVKRSFHE